MTQTVYRDELSLDAYWELRRNLAVFCRIVGDWGYIGGIWAHLDTRFRDQYRVGDHGSVVVGETPEIGLMNVYTVEENVKYQIAGEPFGGAVLFPHEVIEESAKRRGSMTVEISKLLWAYFDRGVFMAGVPL